MQAWSVDVAGLSVLLQGVDADALAIDDLGEDLARAVDDAMSALNGAQRVEAGSALTAFFAGRSSFAESLLGFVAMSTDAVSAATAAVRNGDEEMALNAQAAEAAQQWNLDIAVSQNATATIRAPIRHSITRATTAARMTLCSTMTSSRRPISMC